MQELIWYVMAAFEAIEVIDEGNVCSCYTLCISLRSSCELWLILLLDIG